MPIYHNSRKVSGKMGSITESAGVTHEGLTPEKLFGYPSETVRLESKYPMNGDLRIAFHEHFDYSDKQTKQALLVMTEAEHNKTLTALTGKLYDQIVSKANHVDYGEIPKTKGDITKLSNFSDLKDTLDILKGIVKEYKQDTKPIDEISVAIGNIQGHQDIFERAYRYGCEMPILMYENMVLAVIVGTNYLVSTCIEFIKSPKDDTFTMAMDKVSYNKSKDALIYTSIAKFNRMCKSGDFDNAMNAVIDKKIKKFSGVTIAAGIIVGVVILTNIIPLLRELVYLFFHFRTSVSDWCELQSDLLTMNAYNLKSNTIRTDIDTEEVAEEQLKIAEKFRNASNFFSITYKKGEVEASKDIEKSSKTYKLDADANVVSSEPEEDDGSVLF